MPKGPLYKVTRKATGQVAIMTNQQLFEFVMEITCNDPNIAYSGEIKRKYRIDKIDDPSDVEWLLYGKEDPK